LDIPIQGTEAVRSDILRVELDARVILPARPRIVDRRVLRVVVDDVIHAGDEEVIARGRTTQLRKPRAELGRTGS
jgi:hypothetical protein